ncbi:MAG TPA: hypothetical protein VFK10_09360, partial [Burkholderiaceae bacterium]|nr:hypothetical protein [Burkholderiaceae bacterium]
GRGVEDLDDLTREIGARGADSHAHAFARNREGDRDRPATMARDTIARGVERVDDEVCEVVRQRTSSSSMSNSSVALGGITPPAPRSP